MLQGLEGKLRSLAVFLAGGYRRGTKPQGDKGRQGAPSSRASPAASYSAAGLAGDLPPAKRQRLEAVFRQEEQQCALALAALHTDAQASTDDKSCSVQPQQQTCPVNTASARTLRTASCRAGCRQSAPWSPAQPRQPACCACSASATCRAWPRAWTRPPDGASQASACVTGLHPALARRVLRP